MVAAVFLCLPARAANFSSSVSARSAILVDAQTGRVLYEKNADEQSLIASTTKIMTGLLVCEAGELEREISVPPEAAGVEGSSLYLKAGERITVRELLYGLMLRSGNDAAVALAIATAGSMEAFVGRMNEKAQALGLTNTHFENPNGLDGEVHYSTGARSGKAQRLARCRTKRSARSSPAKASRKTAEALPITTSFCGVWTEPTASRPAIRKERAESLPEAQCETEDGSSA